jgi:hypothetical protein
MPYECARAPARSRARRSGEVKKGREEVRDRSRIAPFIFTTDIVVSGKLPANTVIPWFEIPDGPNGYCGPFNNCWDLSRNLWVYVLSLKVGRDDPRDVLVVQPQMNTFGQFDGSFSTKAYVADDLPGSETDTEGYPWGHRAMTEDVEIELRRQTISGGIDPPFFKLEGFIPANLDD